MTETEIQYPSRKLLEAVLGAEETQILDAIDRGYKDIDSIHFLTGIPVPCIRNKIKALAWLSVSMFALFRTIIKLLAEVEFENS